MPFWVVAILAAGPLLGNEFPLDTNPHVGPAWSTQDLPRAAALQANGAVTLIVWRDFRAGDADIYATRMDASGNVLDLNGIALTSTPASEGPPAVSGAGGDFVVTWVSENSRVEAMRISASGALLEASPVTVSTAPNTSAPAVSCDALNCRFVWVSVLLGQPPTVFTRTSNLSLTSFTPAVPVVTAGGIPHTQLEPTISSGTQFVIAWTDINGAVRSIYAARFDSAGTALDPAGVAVTSGTLRESKPRVASSASKTIISWLNSDGSVDARWMLNGGAFSAGPVPPPLFPGPVAELDVTFSGTNFFVAAARSDSLSIEARTINELLITSSPLAQVASSSNALEQPALAPTSSGALLAFRWQLLGTNHVFAKQLSSSLFPLSTPVCVSRAAAPQDEPRVTFDGFTFVSAWNEARNFASYFPETYATRIQLDGNTSAPMQVSLDHRNVCELAGHAGRTQIVFWEETLLRVEGNRLSSTVMAPLDGLGVGLLPTSYNSFPGLAFGNGRALMAYALPNALGLAFITPDGDAGVRFSLPISNGVDSPRVASDGTDFLVVWLGRDGFFNVNVFGVRVSSTGAFLDPQPFVVATPPGGIFPSAMRVAANGAEYLVVWQDDRLGSQDIYGARVFLDGGTPDSPPGFAVVVAPGEQARPDVVWEGQRWIVAWTQTPDSGLPNVEGRLVNTSPVGTDTVFPIASKVTLEAVPHLASNALGRSLVVYQAFDPTLLNSRVFGKTITRLRPGTRCSQAEQCGSGFCADGVCCNTACNGSSPLDCQACSIAAGAPQSGVCAAVIVGAICRPAASLCDVVEACTGALDCPPDVQPQCDGGVDAGQPDAGTLDGGSDGGSAADDGGAGMDAGHAAGPRTFTVGCGCGSSTPEALLAILALMILARKRSHSWRQGRELIRLRRH